MPNIVRDERTKNLGLPLPYVKNSQAADVERIAQSFTKLDEAYGEVRLKTAEAVEKAAGAEKAGEDAAAALELAQAASLDAAASLGLAHDAQSLAQSAELKSQTAIAKAEEAASSPGALVVSPPQLTLPGQVATGFEAHMVIQSGPIKICGISSYLVSVNYGAEVEVAADANERAEYDFTFASDASTVRVEVRAKDALGNVSEKSVANADVVGLALAPVEIVSPALNETQVAVNPVIKVAAMEVIGAVPDTAKYLQLQIATDQAFTNIVWDSGAQNPAPASLSVHLTGFTLQRSTDYYIRGKWTGTTFDAGSFGAPQKFTTLGANILAVCQTTTGAAGKTFQRVDVAGNAFVGNPAFASHPVYAGIKEQVIDGQYMIGFPKCFVKREILAAGQFTGKDCRAISDIAHPGFEVHPAFLAKDGVTALDMIWVGKYQAIADGSNKAGSKPGSCLVSIDFPTMQARCAARNSGGVAGFHLWNIHEWALIGLLMLVEYAGTDFQTLIGRGHVDNSPSGVQANNHATVAQASWRGLVGLWGNIWQMCDGLRGAQNSNVFRIDMGRGYVNTTITACNNALWPDKMVSGRGNGWSVDHLFLGDFESRAGAEVSAAWPDQQWLYANQGTYEYVTYVGGNYGSAGSCGPFLLSGSSAPADGGSSFGGRLAKW